MTNKLYIFCGIPFSGKSTLTKELARQKGFVRIDLDEVKFDLYGNDALDADLRQKDWDKIYQEMYKRIETALKAGKTVTHDTGNFTKYERGLVRSIADKLGIETVTVYVDTPVDIARQRLVANRTTNHRFNITDKEFQGVVDEMEIPGTDEHTVKYDSGTPVNAWINEYFTK